MSLDNRRNLDFAFPAFAPGLPSVYERAGFDVKQPTRSLKSSRSRKSSRVATPGSSSSQLGTPQSMSSSKFAQPEPPLPTDILERVHTPSQPSSLRSASQPSLHGQEQHIPPRALSRETKPLSYGKESVSSAGSDSTNMSADTGMTSVSPQVMPENEFNFSDQDVKPKSAPTNVPAYNGQTEPPQMMAPMAPLNSLTPTSGYLNTPSSDVNRFSSTSSIYSTATDLRKSEYGGYRKQHPTLSHLPTIQDDLSGPPGVACPYPNTPTPPPDTPVDELPQMPPKAPDHAKRVSSFQKSSVLTHSSSSSQSSYGVGSFPVYSDKICRGCNQTINGRSVYSKDGNMSGRWHRACFGCTSCKSSLTSEVYVLDDSPYCGACYHQSNKSNCSACGEGIEGPCLEGVGDQGEGITRYHPTCLACDTCALRLSDVYYEAGGRTYCEAHGANAKQARRRTTRLLH